MQGADKQNRNTHSVHFHQKAAGGITLNKKYILPGAFARNNSKGCNNYFPNHKSITSHSNSIQLATTIDQDSSVRTEIRPRKAKHSPTKKNKLLLNLPTQKYIPYRNDEKIRQIFESCMDYRMKKKCDQGRPSFESATLLLKVQKPKDSSSSNLIDLQNTINKSNGFTMKVKDLRKRNKNTLRSDAINCRVVNLFESIERKIEPIHKYDTNLGQGKKISLTEYFGSITTSLQQLARANVIEKELVHMSGHVTPNSEAERYLSRINITEDNPQPPIKIARKEETLRGFSPRKVYAAPKEDTCINSSKKQFELKPWSTQQIPIE